MRNTIKKLVTAGITLGGLEYVKYRLNGGRPLLERVKEWKLQILDVKNRVEGKRPIVLETDECKIV